MKKLIYYLVIFFFVVLTILYPSYNARSGDAIFKNDTLDFTFFSKEEPLTYVLCITEQMNEPIRRFEALCAISAAYMEIGEYNKTEYLLSAALHVAQNTKDQLSKTIFFSELIDKYISLNKIEKALEIVKDIDFLDSRTEALAKIAIAYIQQNQYEKALGLSRSINDPLSKVSLLYKLIHKLMEKKLYTDVFRVQKIIKESSPGVRDLVQIIFIDDYIKSSDISMSNLFVSQNNSKRTKALVVMAKKYISLNLYGPAKQILTQAVLLSQDIISDYFKSDNLAQIGIAYVEMGELGKALEIANSIKVTVCRSELLSAIAMAYVKAEDLEKALEITKRVDLEYLRDKVFSQIIIQYIKIGEIEKASRLADSLNKTSSGAGIDLAMADYYVQNENYEKAIEIDKNVKDQFIKFKILLNIAKDMQKKKTFSEVMQRMFEEIMISFN